MSEPELYVEWGDSPIQSYEEGIRQFLFMVDRAQEERGWDQKPLLGPVNCALVGEVASLSFGVPEMDERFWEEFGETMPELAMETFMAEVTHSQEAQEFLDSLVETGYQGWAFSVEFFMKQVTDTGDQVGNQREVRITVLLDVDNILYGVFHVRGQEQPHVLEEVPRTALTRGLALLNAASVMSIVRRNLDTE